MGTMTLNFTTKERYARAVRHLMNGNGAYQLVIYGRYLYDGKYFGFVEFRRKRV